MPIFTYSAADRTGNTVRGERDAESEKILAQLLKAEGLFLLDAGLKRSGMGSLNFRIDVKDILARVMPISVVDKMFMTRNLAVMVSAGFALTRALAALVEESPNSKLRRVLGEVNSSVIKGKTLAESLRIHEKVFGSLFINMIEVGETTGKLTLVLKLLANQMKKDHDLQKRVRGAMIYPALVFLTLLGVGTFMMIYIVPSLSETIQDLGVELPLSTRIVIFISDVFVNYSIWVLLFLIAIGFSFWRALKTSRGKLIFDHVALRFPLLGPLVKKFNIARFSRTLSYLITSGVPIVRSLEITSTVLGNSLFKRAAEQASIEIQKGKQLNEILAEHTQIFQPVVIQMIKVGEETGKVSDLLLRLALFFEEDVTSTTKNLSTVIEPLLMVIIGGAVGFFAVAMLQPIYGSLGNIR